MTYVAAGTQWYNPVIAGASTLAGKLFEQDTYTEYLRILDTLSDDDAKNYVASFVRCGLDRFGRNWRYADIGTAVLAISRALTAQSYLEIGVRRGRSMSMFASQNPHADIVGFDMWIENYAGLDNPGPALVQEEMRKVGFRGNLTLVVGNSHETVPQYMAENPAAWFDVITVDGDHTELGAKLDLLNVMQRLKVGGVLIFDDIVHPSHMYLHNVWNKVVKGNPHFSTYEFTELGHGVAFAVRMS